MKPSDLVDAALAATRDQFIADFPFLFLYSTAVPPTRPTPVPREPESDFDEETSIRTPQAPALVVKPVREIFIIKKNRPTFPSMITIGRTRNNDIVLQYEQISRFHAFFRLGPVEDVTLTDAGSANGTWIGDHRLTPQRGAAVAFGDVVRFAQLEFKVLNAGACWDRMRRLKSEEPRP